MRPLYGGNIGSAVRALATMGFRRLCLVDPKNYPSRESHMFSAGARDLLEKTEVYATLDQALADCDLAVGTSARSRRLSPGTYGLPEGAKKIADYAGESKIRLAILFGSEDRGLENSVLDRCRMHLVIDTDSEYQTLNLAAAVQIVCYELRRIAQAETALPRRYGNPKRDRPAADDARMEGFYKHLEEHLRRIRFFNPQQPATVMRKMRLIFGRAELRVNEVEMLRGMFTNSMRFAGREKQEPAAVEDTPMPVRK